MSLHSFCHPQSYGLRVTYKLIICMCVFSHHSLIGWTQFCSLILPASEASYWSHEITVFCTVVPPVPRQLCGYPTVGNILPSRNFSHSKTNILIIELLPPCVQCMQVLVMKIKLQILFERALISASIQEVNLEDHRTLQRQSDCDICPKPFRQ